MFEDEGREGCGVRWIWIGLDRIGTQLDWTRLDSTRFDLVEEN